MTGHVVPLVATRDFVEREDIRERADQVLETIPRAEIRDLALNGAEEAGARLRIPVTSKSTRDGAGERIEHNMRRQLPDDRSGGLLNDVFCNTRRVAWD